MLLNIQNDMLDKDQEKYDHIFKNNSQWIEKNKVDNPGLFKLLAAEQHPDFLYIGCSDSRVHPNQVMGLKPGEVFIHRNIANMVISTDLSALSVVNYAVEYLKVKFIIVCGHYGCGGIKSAMLKSDFGILNPWLQTIRDVYQMHRKELLKIEDLTERFRRLVEINTFEQCRNIIKIGDVQKAYSETGYPKVAGWIFDIEDARLHDLNFDMEKELDRIKDVYDITGNDDDEH